MSEHVVHITDTNFAKDVLKSDKPVLVDFWADWCAPCKAIAPVLEEIAQEYEGKLKVAKLNVDESPESAAKYQVRGIPTLILFKNGIVEATKIGALTKSQLVAFISGSL